MAESGSWTERLVLNLEADQQLTNIFKYYISTEKIPAFHILGHDSR